MKNQWRIIVGFILILIIVLFAISNNNQVDVSFLVTSMQAPLILIILGSAIIGGLIGILTSTATVWNQKKTIKNQEKELAIFNDDLDKKVQSANEKLIRDYENQISELRATYEAQIVDKNRKIDELLHQEQAVEETSAAKTENHVDYFD
ncbi:LapA family protein [Enterococcus sp. HY326]|uniref:LapA family protein n=1 Tax=Enterococcus sp. HY326 TaxID=2971265 RepID=UPI00223F2847|nr:lipopolysaccharide assembly protein LapA domain-containing protein [Enterococcus sp. HY326]